MAQYIGLARIGRDAELRYTPNGEAVASLNLAFSYGKKGQDGKKPTQWAQGSLWGKRAEAMAPYLTKGTTIYVVLDDAHQEDYTTTAGQSGSKLAGRISVIEFAGKPQQSEAAPEPKPSPKQAASVDEMDSEIPF